MQETFPTKIRGCMPYLNLDLDFFDHPKTKRLIVILGPTAPQLILKLWCHVGKYHAKNGRLDGYSENEIEGLAGWSGEPGKMVEAMKNPGINFLEKSSNVYKIHDWEEHAGHLYIFKKRARLNAKKRWDKYRQGNSEPGAQRPPSSLSKQGRIWGKTLPEPLWEFLKREFDGCCVKCKSTELPVEQDHILPRYLGGSDAIENIQPLCAKCNVSKTNDSIDYRISYLITKGKAVNKNHASSILKEICSNAPNHLNHLNLTNKEYTDSEWPVFVQPEKIVERWNLIPGVKPVTKLGEGLRKRIVLRAKNRDEAWWIETFNRIAKSDFLCNRLGKQWCATLEWCLGPKNLEKIESGNYDNITKPKPDPRKPKVVL